MTDVKIFISYKTDNANPLVSTGLSQSAHMIRRVLEYRHFDVWMDKKEIDGGDLWAKEILKGLKGSDLVLLLISDKSGDSSGQKKEIEQAQTLEKKILPIYIRGNFDPVKVLEDSFDLRGMQLVDFRIGDDDQVNNLLKTIEIVAKEMKLEVPNMNVKRKSKDEVRPPLQQYATYQLTLPSTGKPFPCNIHIAAGNLLKMENIDVFVNSENAYLQMARIFESSTISAILRSEGAYFDDNGYLVEDTIQVELDKVIADQNVNLPAQIGRVLVTSAGHPKSNLRMPEETSPRFIFHTVAVAVRGNGTDKWMDPARDGDIQACTRNTLNKVAEVNKKKGVVSPADTGNITEDDQVTSELNRQVENIDDYKDIKSIILPLFGSGHAGIDETKVQEQVMKPMCEGIKEFIEKVQRNNRGVTSLQDIYVCAYSIKLVPLLRETMLSYFEETKSPRTPIE